MNTTKECMNVAKDNWNKFFHEYCSRNNEDFEGDIEYLKISLTEGFTKELAKTIPTLTLVKISEYLQENNELKTLRTKINQAFIERFSASQSKVNFFFKSLPEKEKSNLLEFLIDNQEYELLLLLPKL